MKRWLLLVVILAALIGIIAWRFMPRRASSSASPPRHFVLIVADALRPDHLGCYGNKQNLSPHIDQLASQSLVFADVSAAGPWTLSSNPGLFCGQYPYEIFDYDNGKLLPRAVTLAEYFKAAGYATAAFSAHPLITKDRGFAQGFDTFVSFDLPRGMVDDAILQSFLKWRAKNLDRPTFLLIYLYDPHAPYDPQPMPPALAEKLKGARDYIKAGNIVNKDNHRKPSIVEDPREQWECSPAEIELLHELYRADIADCDRRIGQILHSLGDTGNSVIALTSDHGEEWLEHGGLFHKETLYRELLHVPLILKIPGRPHELINPPVSNLDLVPTLLELAGLAPAVELRGRTLLTDDFAPDRPLFSEVRYPHKKVHRYALRIDNLTLIHSLGVWQDEPPLPEGGRFECYDLSTDPTQQTNLPADEHAPQLKKLLSAHEAQALQSAQRISAGDTAPSQGMPEDLKEKLEALGYIGK